MNEPAYNPGDRIKVIAGPLAGRTGKFKKHCSSVFPEWCNIILDLTKRERVQKTKMILKSEIALDEVYTG